MASVFTTNIPVKAYFLTKNGSYTANNKKTKTKLMLHSTATPGATAKNIGTSWNKSSAKASTEFCCDDKEILQFLPVGKNGVGCIKSWHCGSSGNNTHIACEMCEPIETQMIPVNYYEQSRNGKYRRPYSIKRIQMELKHLGFYTGEIDGAFGAGTEAAVIAFQKANGLPQTGKVDKYKTLPKLQARSGSYAAYDVAGATPFFNACYDNAVHLYGELCKYTGAKAAQIVCHSEGYKQGIASNHADVMHWFPYHGKSMNSFRSDVQAYINGTYKNLTGSTSANTAKQTYLNSVDAVFKAGIINTPQYWYDIYGGTEVNDNYVMAFLRQAGAYFCRKSFIYGVDCLNDVLGLTAPEYWKNGKQYSLDNVQSLYKAIAAKITNKIFTAFTYEDAVETCYKAGIINTPDYWLTLVKEPKAEPSAACVQAFLRQAGAYFCGTNFQYGISAIKNAIGMNSESYWRGGTYSVNNVVCLYNAIAKVL